MKFEYEEEKETRKCVAYIAPLGHLVVKSQSDGRCMVYVLYPGFDSHETTIMDVCLGSAKWNEDEAIRKFYKGDKITITF